MWRTTKASRCSSMKTLTLIVAWATVLGSPRYYRVVCQDPVTKAVVFESSCDPLDANPNGGQIFAMRPDGRGLRQLTDASGITRSPDGSVSVELPGPFAYSAVPR
jgi:hypothetical protein